MLKKKAAAHENHDRWLVSYADFMTLLFAFFVVMFASTQADKGKAKAVSDSVREALQNGQFSVIMSTMLGRGKHENSKPPTNPERVKQSDNLPPVTGHPGDLVKSLATLQKGLEPEVKTGKVDMRLEARGLVISLREAAFFASGDDKVAPASIPILAKIVAVILPIPNPVRLEGYTDSIPIHTPRFRSNWDLSTARGIAMLELMRTQFQVPAERLSVAGYAENAPADTNDTEEGRAHNRRVDVVVVSAEAIMAEPHAGPGAAKDLLPAKKL